MYNTENSLNPEEVNNQVENNQVENNQVENNESLNLEPINPETVNNQYLIEPIFNDSTPSDNNENNNEDASGLGDILGKLSELLKDDKMQNLANMDVSHLENDMNNMINELTKRNDPNIMSMLNLFNNLSISNLTDSNFSLGDCDVSNLGNQNTFSDTSDEDEQDEDEDYEQDENNDNSSTDTDEDLLNYMKDREDNEDMVLSIKQKLEEID